MSLFAAGTWLAIGVGTLAAGTAYSAYSSYEQGQNAEAIARYNAQNQQAQNQSLLQQTAAKSLAERDDNQRIMGEQEAAFAASGVVTATGSPLTVETKQAALLERKALNTDYEGALAARYGESSMFDTEMQGASSEEAGNLGSVSTILGGASKVAGTLSDYYG